MLTKERIFEELKEQWSELLQDSADLNVDIQLLTADGKPGQPLAYDIVQKTGDESYTYTWVEQPEMAEDALGLTDVTYEQAVATLHNLLHDVHSSAGSPLADLKLTSVIRTDGVGLTYGRSFAPELDTPASFPTNYQAYFTTNLLRTFQEQQSGVLFNQITAYLTASGNFSLSFGAQGQYHPYLPL